MAFEDFVASFIHPLDDHYIVEMYRHQPQTFAQFFIHWTDNDYEGVQYPATFMLDFDFTMPDGMCPVSILPANNFIPMHVFQVCLNRAQNIQKLVNNMILILNGNMNFYFLFNQETNITMRFLVTSQMMSYLWSLTDQDLDLYNRVGDWLKQSEKDSNIAGTFSHYSFGTAFYKGKY